MPKMVDESWEDELIIGFVEWPRRYRLQILDILQLLPESSTQYGAKDCLADSSICSIDLEHSELRPKDRANCPHIVSMVCNVMAKKYRISTMALR